MLCKESLKFFFCKSGINGIVYGYGNAFPVAFSGTEASRKGDVRIQPVLGDGGFKQLHNILGAFQIAGGAYADLYNHMYNCSFLWTDCQAFRWNAWQNSYTFAATFSMKNVLTVSGVTEKNASSTVTHTPC